MKLDGLVDGVRTEPGDIPESCVTRVFLHLTQPEICNLTHLNRAFRSVASSDSFGGKNAPQISRSDRLSGSGDVPKSIEERHLCPTISATTIIGLSDPLTIVVTRRSK
ncbi:hypothetical protein U1Q18_001933 [Sarracenia purpurea var. burkii]